MDVVVFPSSPPRFSTEIVDMLLKAWVAGRPCVALTGLHKHKGNNLFGKIAVLWE
jgi:hypothetical protein